MKGPFPLTSEELNKAKYNEYGNYLLCVETPTSHKVHYVGRGHLKTRIARGLDIKKYTHFYYEYNTAEIHQFKKECTEFHRYGKANDLDNKIHPAKPTGYHKKCTEFGCNGEDR